MSELIPFSRKFLDKITHTQLARKNTFLCLTHTESEGILCLQVYQSANMQPKVTSAGEQLFKETDPLNAPDKLRVGQGILQDR